MINIILGPIHMHTFTGVSKATYVSKFTYGVIGNAFTYVSINTPGVNLGK